MLRAQMQQPLNAEILSQQQQLQQQMNAINSPKRDGRTLLSQNIIHQSYGVAQQQGGPAIGGNVITAGSLIGAGVPVSGNSISGTGSIPRQRPAVNMAPTISNVGTGSNVSTFLPTNANMGGILPQHLSMGYYTQPTPSQSYFGEMIHPMQVRYCISMKSILF